MANTITKRYVAKDKEKITVEFNDKVVEIRRIWDTKKSDTKVKIHEVEAKNVPYVQKTLELVRVCTEAVGIKWDAKKVANLGQTTWREDGDEYEDYATKILYLSNGGQVRICRRADGSQAIELDLITESTVKQVVADVRAWTDEDQEALEEYNRYRKSRAAKHREFEAKYVREFTYSLGTVIH